MNGVTAIRALLVAASGVTDLVAAARIQAGVLPTGTALPAIAITPVSSVDVQFVPDQSARFTTDRVQVTVMASDYPSLQSVLSAVRSAGDAKAPTVSGIENVIVRTDGQGPWFMDEAASFHIQTQDFKVSYSRAA